MGLSSFSLAIRSVRKRACGRRVAVDVDRGVPVGALWLVFRGRREPEEQNERSDSETGEH